MITKTVNLYTFEELSDKAKERARTWWRECEAQDFSAHGELNEQIETAAKLLGIDLKRHDVKLLGGGTRSEPNIWWTLHVQGSGASFDGTYSYHKGSVKAVRAEFPQDEPLQAIATGLAELQKKYRYKVSASIKSDSRGHFLDTEYDMDVLESDVKAFDELFSDFCRWIYEYIDAEYEYRMADENVDESITANEYTFTVDGKRDDN